jgi:thiamine monophosphate kinase
MNYLRQRINSKSRKHGEDYELLFTAPRGKRISPRIAGVPITLIGHITRHRKIFLMNRNGVGYELEPRGWEHFRSQNEGH